MKIGELPQIQSFHANLQKARRYINHELGTPAVILKRNGSYYLAVSPNPKKVDQLPEELSITGVQRITINLQLCKGVHTINLAQINDADTSLVEDFLSFNLRSSLRYNTDLWNGASPYIYYTKAPMNLKTNNTENICIYPGFRYRVRVIDHEAYVAVDITHVYVDSRKLAERIADGTEWRHLTGRYFLYEFGPQWYFIQFKTIHSLPIGQAKFEYPAGTGEHVTVYDYTMDTWGQVPSLRTLTSDDETIVYNNSGQNNEHYAATSLARLRYNTTDPEIGKLHSKVILDPNPRLKEQQRIIAEYIDGQIHLDDSKVKVTRGAKRIHPKQFPTPSFKFGNGEILPSVSHYNDFKEMLRKRKRWIESDHIGLFAPPSDSMNQFILSPLSVAADENLLSRIQEDVSHMFNRISHQDYYPDVLIWDDTKAKTLSQIKQEIIPLKEQIQATGGIGQATLIILPDSFSGSKLGKVRRLIKSELWPVRTKCIQISQFKQYLKPTPAGYEVTSGIYRSSMYNTVLKHLVVSGAKPWVLNDPLHYDLYIGVDVLNEYAGFTLFAAGEELLQFIPRKSGYGEKLSAKLIAEVLLDKNHLPRFIERLKKKIGRLPQHIIFQRDGRTYDDEIEGYEHVFKQLQENDLLISDSQLGVVEIHKSNSESLRMYHRNGRGRISNPIVGRYHILNPSSGVIATTGFPVLNQGTAAPLVAKVKYGNLSIEKVLQDIFHKSMLSWTKPDGVQSTPITIKVLDDWLEAIATEVSGEDDSEENEGLQDEVEIEHV